MGATEKVHEILRLAGRDVHPSCRPPRRYRTPVVEASEDDEFGAAKPAPAPPPEIAIVLDLDGTERDGRSMIRIDGKPLWIQNYLFGVLAGLVGARLGSPGAWTMRDKLGVARLKEIAGKIHQETKALLPPDFRLVETARPRLLRLAEVVELGVLNWRELRKHSHPLVAKLVQQHARRHG